MPDMVNVRKVRAGTDSAGHTWPTDGAVIEVPVEHALLLARIPDGGFVILEDLGVNSGSEATEPSAETPAKTAATRSKAAPA